METELENVAVVPLNPPVNVPPDKGNTLKFDAAAAAVVAPVPPFATASVPASVIAPVVAVDGVNPVDPALNDETPPEEAAHVAVVPFDVRT